MESICRLGLNWCGAHNKPIHVTLMRSWFANNNYGGYGQLYEKLRQAAPKAETSILTRFCKASLHTQRIHRRNVSDIIARLFEHTPGDVKLNVVKEKVFGVQNGEPIMTEDHPVIAELLAISPRLTKGSHCVS